MAQSTLNSNKYLTPGQENLLTAALNSNKNGYQPSNGTNGWSGDYDSTLDSLLNSQRQNSIGTMDEHQADFFKGANDLDFSLDSIDANAEYDEDFDDQSPVNESAEPHEKRQRPDDDKDKSKSQDGSQKVPKKPGRKPLTVEPTNKRKAQNRAAQRAFRERKEKHVKDMEVRVEELEKASEEANNQNGILKAKIERLQNELRDYKKRLSLNSSTFSQSNPMSSQLNMFLANNNSSANNVFNFEVPQFGNLPTGPNNILGNNADFTTSPTSTNSPVNRRQSNFGAAMATSGSNGRSASPQSQGRFSISSSSDARAPATRQASNGVQVESINNDGLAGLFGGISPGIAPTTRTTSTPRQDSMSSNATSYPNRIFQFNSNAASTASPSASSNSHYDEKSSCATSPEPTTNSPALKNKDSIAETKPSQTSPFMGFTNSLSPEGLQTFASPATGNLDQKGTQSQNGIEWLAAQNGGQFDPTLFGDYRESQLNIVGDGEFTGGFFDSALGATDYSSPSNWFNFSNNFSTGFTPAIQKVNPLEQADLVSAGYEVPLPVPPSAQAANEAAEKEKLIEKLSHRKEFQDGTMNIDLLCEEFKKKCHSGCGVSITQADVNAAMDRQQRAKNPFDI